MHAGINIDVAGERAAKCYGYAESSQELGRLPKDVTVDDAAAIALYTMETKALKKNPYSMINEALMNGDMESLEPVKDLLYAMMSALRKLPIVYGKPLYRGIRSRVADGNGGPNRVMNVTAKHVITPEKAHSPPTVNSRSSRNISEVLNSDRALCNYAEGEEVTWNGISSTSPDVAVTKAFLARGRKTGTAEGTLFIIEDGWGYNVQPCSMFPDEEEIVLEPERRFRVKTVIPGEGLTIIKMEMLKTPPILPQVFGKKEFGLFQ